MPAAWVFLHLILGLSPIFSHAIEANLNVEGMILGLYPRLGEGFHLTYPEGESGGMVLQKAPRRCFTVLSSMSSGQSTASVYFAPMARSVVKDRFIGLGGYPAVSNGESWLRNAKGLAYQFYRALLYSDPPNNVIEYLYVPIYIEHEGRTVTEAKLTPEAYAYYMRHGTDGITDLCGSQIVERTEGSLFTIYAVRIEFLNADQRKQAEASRLPLHVKTPDQALETIRRLWSEGEISGPEPKIHVHALQVGSTESETQRIFERIREDGIHFETEKVDPYLVIYGLHSCSLSNMDRCEKLIKAYLDSQFNNMGPSNYGRGRIPVRFKLSPIQKWLPEFKSSMNSASH